MSLHFNGCSIIDTRWYLEILAGVWSPSGRVNLIIQGVLPRADEKQTQEQNPCLHRMRILEEGITLADVHGCCHDHSRKQKEASRTGKKPQGQ